MGLLGTFIRAFMIYRGANHPDIWVLPFSHFDSVLGGIVIGLGVLDKPLKKIPNLIWLALGILALWQVTQLPNVTKIPMGVDANLSARGYRHVAHHPFADAR
jgi:hypothetical protein